MVFMMMIMMMMMITMMMMMISVLKASIRAGEEEAVARMRSALVLSASLPAYAEFAGVSLKAEGVKNDIENANTEHTEY
jgi:hypothetical protein